MVVTSIYGINIVFFFKQKTAYEIGTGDWSSDVCSSDLDDRDDRMLIDEALEESKLVNPVDYCVDGIDLLN